MKKESLLRGALTAGALVALAVGALAAAPAANAVDINGWTGTGDTRTASAEGATATITATDKMQVKRSGDAVDLSTVRDGGELGLNLIGLPELYPCKNGIECVRGKVIVDFGRQVTNPKIKLGSLGGEVFTIPGPTGGTISSTAKYTLQTPGVSLSSVGGNLDVAGNTITSNDFGAKSGTVQVNGTVSRVEFQVTMRSKGVFSIFNIPVWSKVSGDLHSIDIDVDKPKPPTKPVLTIDKDDTLGEVALGQALTYNIIVKNTGDGQAQGVVVSDPLPAGLDFVSGSGPAGTTVTASGRNVTATLGTLAPGQSVILKVNAKVNQSAPPGPLTNEACVVGANAAKACDTDTDTVKREFFQYTFNSSPTDPKPGETVTYRMEFANNGNVDSANSEIAYNLAGILDDSSWNPSSVTATSGNATVDGNSIDWKGPLASGQTVVITFTGVWNGNGDGFAFPGVAYYGSAR
jgi:uncharacterized repeat protein (TIGR01451 family)